VKKNRDILLDFEYGNYTVYEFNTVSEIEYLQTHGRAIILQISENDVNYTCPELEGIAAKYKTLFNYVCYYRAGLKDFKVVGNKIDQQFYFIVNSVGNGTWINNTENVLDYLPKNSSRQKVSTET